MHKRQQDKKEKMLYSPRLQASVSVFPIFASTQSIRLMTLYPDASLDRIEEVHEEQPHLEVSVGGGGVTTTGLRVGLGVERDGPSLPKNVPEQKLTQFEKLWLHHESGQLTPLSHEQPVHFELLAVVVTSVVSGVVVVTSSVLVVVVLVLLVVVSGLIGGGVGYYIEMKLLYGKGSGKGDTLIKQEQTYLGCRLFSGICRDRTGLC